MLLFVSSAAWTLTNLRDELGDILAGEQDTIWDLTLAGLGLGETHGREGTACSQAAPVTDMQQLCSVVAVVSSSSTPLSLCALLQAT